MADRVGQVLRGPRRSPTTTPNTAAPKAWRRGRTWSLSFCDQVPVGHDTSDVSARRIQNWLYAWQRFAAAPAWRGLRPGLAERLTERLLADGRAPQRSTSRAARNHRTLELYALARAGAGLRTGRRRGRDAWSPSRRMPRPTSGTDGVHCECSSDYHMIVLRSFVGAIANARLAGIPVPRGAGASGPVPVRRGAAPPATRRLDAGPVRRRSRRLPVPACAGPASCSTRPDLLWAATAGAEGRPPATRAAGFPVGGYFVQRSGWGDGQRRVLRRAVGRSRLRTAG